MDIDANAVIDKLKKTIGDLIFQIGILEIQNEQLVKIVEATQISSAPSAEVHETSQEADDSV